jgi:hypothetical protein
MRKILLLAPALLSACAANAPPADSPGPPRPTPVHGETPGHTCSTAGTDRFIGLRATSDTGAEIMRATKAAVLRWAPPGYVLTMDFRADRVTVYLGPDYKVTEIKCM